jgi:hypothetical protein
MPPYIAPDSWWLLLLPAPRLFFRRHADFFTIAMQLMMPGGTHEPVANVNTS